VLAEGRTAAPRQPSLRLRACCSCHCRCRRRCSLCHGHCHGRCCVCSCVCVLSVCLLLMKRGRLSAPAAVCGAARGHREWVHALRSDYETRVSRASATVDSGWASDDLAAENDCWFETGSASDADRRRDGCDYLSDLPSRFCRSLEIEDKGNAGPRSSVGSLAAIKVTGRACMGPPMVAIEAVDAHWLQAHPPLLKRQKRWPDLRSQLAMVGSQE